MFEIIKKALRFSNSALDDEIKDNIDTALLDMSRVGVIVTNDKLCTKCVELYCKYAFNFNNEAERYFKRYSDLRDALSLCSLYNGGDTDE